MKNLEKLLGHDKYMKIKQFIKYIRDNIYFLSHKKIQIIDNDIEYKIFSKKNKHIYFGYYDIQQLNKDENKMLVHVIDKKANTSKNLAEIGFYNLDNNEYIKIAQTHAWNWQQGSRLRWWPSNEKYICFNDIDDKKYVCKKVNIETKQVEQIFCKALYDIDNEGTYGLSLNFSRLQRLRPGYGYDYFQDKTMNISSPLDDGIHYVDLLKNKSHLIISIGELAKRCEDCDANEHYINHISISPNGEKFMFFHLWTRKKSNKWKTCLYVANKDGSNLKLLEKEDLVSHYDWIDSDNILVTGYTPNGKQTYSRYNVNSLEKNVVKSSYLDKDGHPTVIDGGRKFITDTYPKKMDLQELFEYNTNNSTKKTLMYIYSSPLMYEEKRCDLHPRVSNSEKIITIDSTVKNNCKSVIVIKKIDRSDLNEKN